MEHNKAYETQIKLVASLRELAGAVNSSYVSQKEFLIVTLNDMAGYLAELKREQLSSAVGRFLARLARGPVAPADITDLKVSLDKLVASKDFDFVCAGLAGSNDLIRDRLARLQPLTIAAEERRGAAGRDPAAERLVAEAYRHLQFEALEKEAARFRDEASENRVLARLRERVAEYCAVYRLPLSPADTLPPFSLSRIDAVTAACYRLLSRLRDNARR